MDVKVSSTTRHIETEVTPGEARKVVDWVQEVRRLIPMPPEAQLYLGVLYAVANQREYGGH